MKPSTTNIKLYQYQFYYKGYERISFINIVEFCTKTLKKSILFKKIGKYLQFNNICSIINVRASENT